MINHFFSIPFLKYYLTATSRYKVHSPFVFDFVENVLEDKRTFYAFDEVEALRKLIYRDKRSVSMATNQPSNIKTIARKHTSLPYCCRVLFKTIHHYKPKTILELGTTFGVTTIYAATAALDRKVFTTDASSSILNVAKENFKLLGVANIHAITDDYSNALDQIEAQSIQCLIINPAAVTALDANAVVHLIAEKGMVIVTDIQNTEAQLFWKSLQETTQMSLSIDLFQMGIIWKNNEVKAKQSHTLIPSHWRLWI